MRRVLSKLIVLAKLFVTLFALAVAELYVGDLLAAGRTYKVIGVERAVEANYLAAGGALKLVVVLLIVKLVLKLVLVIVVLVIIVGHVEILLYCAEILIKLLNILAQLGVVCLKRGDVICHLVDKLKHLSEKLGFLLIRIKLVALKEATKICGFLINIHFNFLS